MATKKTKQKSDRYAQRGVDATKTEVHKAVAKTDKGIFPNAFCKIFQDPDDKDSCIIMHGDGAGTKSSLAYIYWRETGDLSVWKGIAQDALVMNLDDLICVGVTDESIYFNSAIGRNKHLIPGEVLNKIINGVEEIVENLRLYSINIIPTGGETADIGDLVRTLILDNTVFVKMRKDKVIENNIQDGDLVIGFSSTGQAKYESEYNGGMGSNGLTSARHDVFCKEYVKKYPESFDPKTKKKFIYCGPYKVTSKVPIKWFRGNPKERPKNMGKLVLSPTRTYAPVISAILRQIPKEHIHGMIQCTGSAQTKVLNFIENLDIVKHNMFPIPPLFNIIQQISGTSWEEMYKVFNMGHRIELYVCPSIAQKILDIASFYNIDAQIIGYAKSSEKKRVTIRTYEGEFVYE